MTRGRRWSWTTAVTLVVAGGIAALSLRDRQRVHFDWPVGSETVFDLDWTRVESASLGATVGLPAAGIPMGGDMRIGARLTVRSLQRIGDGWRLQLRLADFRAHRFVLAGTDLLADAAALDQTFCGPQATVDIDVEPSGRVLAERFVAGAPDLFKHLMHALVTESQIVLAGGPAKASHGWTDTTPTLVGTARVRYDWESTSPRVLARTLQTYVSARVIPTATTWRASRQDLSSRGQIVIDDDGRLRSIDEQEDLRITAPGAATALTLHSTLRLYRRTTGMFPLTAVVRAFQRAGEAEDVRQPGDFAVSATTDRRLLEQRIGDMTAQRLTDDLLAFGNGGEMPNHNRWLWQATGLLRAHPELCADLVPLFARREATPKGRLLIMDLLANAGHPDAQGVMRKLLASDVARADAAQHAALLQRFSLVSRPDAESLAFVANTRHVALAGNDATAATASLYALGAAVGHASSAGDEAAAAPFNQQLRTVLTAATGAGEQESALRALGNAGLPANVDLVVPFATAPQPQVREAAAAALRKTATADANRALLALVADPDARVAASALDSLGGHRLNDAEWDRLAALVLAGGTAAGADTTLVNFLSANLDRGKSGDMLRLLGTRNAAHPKIDARIRRMLDGLAAP